MASAATERRPAAIRAQRIDHPADVARPFAWIAALCFTAGFWGYIAFAPFLGR